MYGFPIVYHNPGNIPLRDWLIKNGYPERMCTENNLKYIRYIGRLPRISEVLASTY